MEYITQYEFRHSSNDCGIEISQNPTVKVFNWTAPHLNQTVQDKFFAVGIAVMNTEGLYVSSVALDHKGPKGSDTNF